MKKVLIYIFFSIIFISVNAQIKRVGDIRAGDKVLRFLQNSDTGITEYQLIALNDTAGIYIDTSGNLYLYDNIAGIKSLSDLGNLTFDGNRIITRSGSFLGITPGGDNVVDFLNNLLYPTTSPTATINVSGYGTSKEFASAGTDAITANWSITRPASCLAISSVVVRGKTITPTPAPAEGASVSSTLDTTITKNTNTTFTITVTSADAKTGTANTTVTWYWKRYWGAFVSAVAPTDPSFSISNAEILALTSNELSTTYVKSFGTVNTSGNYFIYAFPSSWGTPKFFINGFETAFIKVKSAWSFTNASGGVSNYDVYCSPHEYGTSFTLSTTN